jgi:cob(I)alamin adenosyltransferase
MKQERVNVPRRSRLSRGLVQIFTGDGKGKTSAALGGLLRATGHGLHVCIIQFMKGGFPYGERRMLGHFPNVNFQAFGQKTFVDPNNVKANERLEGKKALDAACEAMYSGDYDLIILDEINVALAWNLVKLKDVEKLVSEKPKNVELILTGRYAHPRLIDLADLVTIMVKVKHPYDKGIKSRKGIEY